MLKNKKFYSYFLLCLTLLFTSVLQAQSSPQSVLQGIADHMIAGLKSNKATLKTKPQVVYNLAYKYIVPYADLEAMSKRVISPSIWNSATPEQRKQFQHEFTTTLIRTYASALTSYRDQTIRIFPTRSAGGKTVEVNSEIVSSETQPIRVTYRMINSGGQWKLYDMSIEGVSMLESFRSQFADILAQGNMNQLLNRMSGHNQGRS